MKAKNLNFTIDIKNTDEGIKQLLHEIKPTWEWNNVEKKVLSGGYSNIMLRLYDKSNRDDSVTVRIRNALKGATDQQKCELKLLPILSEMGQFPDLLAIFQNGYCYQYIKGQPVINLKTGESVLSDTVLKAVAKKLVNVHTMKILDLDYSDSTYFEILLNLLDQSQYQPPNSRFPTKEILKQESKYIESFLDKQNTPIGLCHGDLQFGNMVWNQAKETITFVDWEMVHVGFVYQDIIHITSLITTWWAEIASAFNTNINGDAIPKDYPDKFCKFYYEEWVKHHNKEFVQKEFEAFRSTVKLFELCDAFMFLLVGLFFPEDKALIPDIAKYRERSLALYLEIKKKHCDMDKFGNPDP